MINLRAAQTVFLSFGVFLTATSASGPNKPPSRPPEPSGSVNLSIPEATQALQDHIYFERNNGQADSQVLYLSHSLDYSLFLTRTGATLVYLESPAHQKTSAHQLPSKQSEFRPRTSNYFTLQFTGANPHPAITGIDQLPGESNYFLGSNPKSWHTQIPQFSKVRYANLYPGIDLVFYSRDGHLEYDLFASPGADLAAVNFKILHAHASLSPGGDVLLTALDSHQPVPLRLKRASAYQPADPASSRPRTLNARYALRGDDLSFTLSAYDRTRSLIIDPALIFSTYLGSNCAKCSDLVAGLAVDSTGIYLTGSTDATSFPADANEPAFVGNSRTFVVKLNPSASQIVYATFLGGSSGSAIAVDSAHSPYVTGLATVPASGSNSFPLTNGVYSNTVPASLYPAGIAYAAKLSPNGSQIVYSTLLQKPYPVGTINYSNYAVPSNIAVDSQGALYVTGTAFIDVDAQGIGEWQPLSTTPGAFQTGGGVFALKLAPAATAFQYSTYVDGITSNGTDEPEDLGISAAGIAVDANGDAFLTGTGESGFPTTSGVYDPTTPALSAYLMEMNPTGTAPIFSTLYADASSSSGLALDSQGEAVMVGSTVVGSPVPVTSNAFCGVPVTFNSLGFIAKFTAGGTGLVYSTTLCAAGTVAGDGTGNSGGNAVAVDSTGAAYVTGFTDDPASFQSVLSQPVRAYYLPGYINQLALKLDTSGNLQWATFLGANQAEADDQFGVVVIDPSNAMYVLYHQDKPVQTLINFPTTPDTVGLPNEGPGESAGNFLLKIAPSLGSPVPLPSPNLVAFPGQPVGSSSSSVAVQIGNYGDAPLIPASVTATGDFSEVDTCSAPVPPGGECDVNITFSPTAAGALTGTLTINFTAAISAITVPLSGTGTVAGVNLSPSSLSFGMEPNGTASAAQQITVTNGGTAPLTITSTVTTTEFNATNTCAAPIAVGDTCTIQVTFTPTASGSQSGTLTITDNAPNSPQIVPLLGNQPPNFALSTGAGSSSASVSPGDTAKFNLNLRPMDGFTGSVSFTCSGAPSNSTCSVSPNPASVTGTATVAVVVSVATQAASTASPTAFPHFLRWWQGPVRARSRYLAPFTIGIVSFALLELLVFLRDSLRHLHRGNQFIRAVFTGAAVLSLLTCAACGGSSSSGGNGGSGGGGSSGTPAGSYTLSVTATSGSITQTINLTLTVK